MSRPSDPEKTKAGIEASTPEESAASEAPSAASARHSSADPLAAEAPPNLAEELAKLKAEKEELFQSLVRRQADFENTRKRLERERKEDRDHVIAALAESLIPVLDGFERALAAHHEPVYAEYRRGFELLYRQLQEVLARQGVTRLDAEGKPFDPHWHHAVERVESEDYPDGTIIEQLQPGYKFRNRPLRPAMVRVAIRPAKRTAGARSEVN